MEHKDAKISLGTKLQISSIYSIRISSAKLVILKKTAATWFEPVRSIFDWLFYLDNNEQVHVQRQVALVPEQQIVAQPLQPVTATSQYVDTFPVEQYQNITYVQVPHNNDPVQYMFHTAPPAIEPPPVVQPEQVKIF